MHKLKAALVGLLCLVAITSCTTNTNPGDVKFTTVATMQLAVGTINDTAGTLETGATCVFTSPVCPISAAGSHLNAVSTFRNQAGNSAFITPGSATLAPGAGAGNIGSLFNYGQSPGHNGTRAQGPSFAAPGSGTGYLNDNLVFGLPPLPGAVPQAYTLSTVVSVSGVNQNYSASATLASLALLAFAGNCAYATDGLGGGTMTCPAAAAGIEQVVFILAGAGSNITNAAIIGVVEVKPGTTTTVVADGTFAAGAATGFVVDADYPMVEAGPVNSPAVGTPTPVITNGAVNPQADLSAGGYFAIAL